MNDITLHHFNKNIYSFNSLTNIVSTPVNIFLKKY